MTAAEEQQLILQVKEGSHGAFRSIVERYMKQAYNVAYGFVNDHDEAEDVAQEAFVRVYQSISSFRGEAEFGTWLYRIVANLSLNRMRKRKSLAQRMVRAAGEMATPPGSDAACHAQDLRMIMERTIHELPTLQRAVVILRHLNGLSTKQVSRILQCSEGTVKTHLHRGLKKMKIKMSFLLDDGV